MKNKVQVFGLHRSGTNLMEWNLVHNFKELNYQNIFTIGNIKNYLRYGEREAVKHTYPNLKYSDYAIIIYKPFDDWVESINRYTDTTGWELDKVYTTYYIEKANKLPKEKTAIINYDILMSNYEEILEFFADKFNLELNPPLERPKNRLTRQGAITKQTNQPFHYNK